MRRGLIAWSKSELPEAALAARVERVRAALSAAKFDALAVYTNNTRPGGVSWLTGFVPYWSEAMLVLQGAGKTRLVAALSKRVTNWIKETSNIATVVSAPRIGVEAGKLGLAAGGQVGVVDLDTLPSGVTADMRGAGATLLDATSLFADLRASADPAEIALAARAGAIAHAALGTASAAASDASALVAAVEASARNAGAEECYAAVAPDLDRDWRLRRLEGSAALGTRFAIRASVAYKGTWVRATRTLSRNGDGRALMERAAERLGAAVAALPGAHGFDGMASWLVEGCRGTQPLVPLMGAKLSDPEPPAPRALVSVHAAIIIDGATVLAGAPVLMGGAGEAAGFLVAPLYD